MRRILYVVLTALLLGLAANAWAQDSLGDYARKMREQQKPASPTTKVWTNDDIGSPSAAPAAPAAPAAAAATTSAAAPAAKAKDAKKDETQKSPDEIAQEGAAWKGKIAAQKAKIAEIQRNIDVAQREYKLRTIDWYTNAGNALLDQKKWHDQEERYQKEVADRQKELADAQQKLEDMREEIRKAGLPSSFGD